MNCRFCGKSDLYKFINLGSMPPSNSLLTKEQLREPESYYPLELSVCRSCWLVQIPEYIKATEIFRDNYPYHSSQSPANVSHAKEYVEMICKRFELGKGSHVLEIGSNDGYMLQWFKEKGCTVLGIDPAKEAAIEARKKGIPTEIAFFSVAWTNNLSKFDLINKFDLICGINVLAHQPDLNDFIKGMKAVLKPNGIITIEFPHLTHLVDECQFDTIYSEHYSYFSFTTIHEIFEKHKLEIFDVDEISEHGGSLRIYVQHASKISAEYSQPAKLIRREYNKGVTTIAYYQNFQRKVNKIEYNLMNFLLEQQIKRKRVIAYGAAAKTNTIFNYCRIKPNTIPFVVDRSPYKIGKYLPGSHIPIVDEEELKRTKPEYVLITAWNLKEEIMKQLKYIREWEGKFVTAIPKLEVL